MSSPYDHDRELAESVDIPNILPMIRRGIAVGSVAADGIDDLLVLYQSEFIITSIRKHEYVPDAVYMPNGVESLLQLDTIGPVHRVRWDSLSRAEWGKRGSIGSRIKATHDIGREFRFILNDGRFMRCQLCEEEATMVIVILQRLLGGKAIERKQLQRYKSGKRPMRRRENSPTLRRLALLVISVTVLSLTGDRDERVWMALAAISMYGGGGYIYLLTCRAYSPGRKAEFHRLEKANRGTSTGEKPKIDRSHLRPLRNAWAGAILKVIGGILLLLGICVQGMQGCPPEITLHGISFEGEILAPIFRYLSYILYVLSAVPLWLGYRLMLKTVDHSRKDTSDPPILFLRPFTLDNRYDFNPDRPLTTFLGIKPIPLLRKLGPLGEVHPLRLIRLLLTRGAERAEEQMAIYFRRIAPFLAIGQPGERLVTPGAQRAYLFDAEWRSRVKEMIFRSRFVVLQPASSEGVVWEINQAFTIKGPSKVLVCLAHLEGSQARWDGLRLLMERELDIHLPRSPGAAVFLHFSNDGAVERLPRVFSHPFKWTWTGCCIDFEKTLAPFLISQGVLPSDTPRGGRRKIQGWSAWWPALASQWVFFIGTSVVYILSLTTINKSGFDTLPQPAPSLEEIAQQARDEYLGSAPSPLKTPDSINKNGWTIKQQDSFRGNIYSSIEGDFRVGVLVRELSLEEQRSPGSSNSSREALLDDLKSSGAHVELLEIRERLIDDYEWTEADYRVTSEKRPRWLRVRYITPGDKIVMFSYDSPEDTGLAGLVEAESSFDTKFAFEIILKKLASGELIERQVPGSGPTDDN